MKFLFVLAAILLGGQTLSYLDQHQDQWKSFKLKYGKNYSSEIEENFRLMIFVDKLHKIEIHNRKYDSGLVSFKLGVNEFTDLLHHEFLDMYSMNISGSLSLQEKDNVVYIPLKNDTHVHLDWRKVGAVTQVKHQAPLCRSSWSFSATGAVEGRHAIDTGDLVSLSEQNLLDCSGFFGNQGCDGGWPWFAFEYIRLNRGIDTAYSYPYEGVQRECRYNRENSAARILWNARVPPENERQLQAAVDFGPVSVLVNARLESFMGYSGGIYDDADCSPNYLNHAMLVVGYGIARDNDHDREYWIVKNSWGPEWGVEGYMHIARNKGNLCGIADFAAYPI